MADELDLTGMPGSVNSEHAPPEAVGPHLRRSARRGMTAMARALDIDVADPKYRDWRELWREICERMAGGVMHSNEHIIGDPFAIFLTGVCDRHPTPWEQTAVVKSPNGGAIDQAEGEKILRYLKDQPEINTCEQCGEPITIYRSDMTRMSVRRDQERQMAARSN